MTAEYTSKHLPVLLSEVLNGLGIQPSGVYLDATFGRGGHSREILRRLGPNGRLFAMDKDPEAVAFAHSRLRGDRRFLIESGSFTRLAEMCARHEVTGRVAGVLLDLGVSSPQLDDPERGFSFLQDGPLDMRMDPGTGRAAADWLDSATAQEIERVLKSYGEERYAKRIARALVAARKQEPIRTTGRLAGIIAAANPNWERGKHPATRSFLGIRLFVNRELEDLQLCLPQTLTVLAAGGRLAVISFHSLEDRIVKRFMRNEARGDVFPTDMPIMASQLNARLRVEGKAVRATEDEVQRNPRARSAVLRVAERL